MPPPRLFSLLLVAAAGSVAYAVTTCSVLEYGGVADGKTDVGPAITKAYAECVTKAKASGPADRVLHVPPGTYAFKTPIRFSYAESLTVEIDGDLNLIFDPSLGGNMVLFDQCHDVVWKGTGTINGNGGLWRPDGDLSQYPNRPRLLRFQNCNNVDISGVSLLNAPMYHLVIIGDNNVVHDMKIVADHIGETDGVDVSGNNNHVHDLSVENGDECVTVKAPTNGFIAENIECHYSAGCNIGSFGRHVMDVSVQNVYYRNVAMHDGDGGIVLKSYPTASGLVKNVTYADFTITNVGYPIQISNFWCPHEASCPPTTGDLTWEDIKFERITGTGDSSDRPVINLQCIQGHECSGLVFEDVTLTKEQGIKAVVKVSNACGTGMPPLPTC